MLQYPMFDPIAISLGPIAIRWYGLAYAVGLLLAWGLGHWAIWRGRGIWADWQNQQDRFDDLVFRGMFAVIVGGRIGYMLFYDAQAWFQHPLLVLQVWQGGMSFHGGLLGLVGWFFWQSWRQSCSVFELSDSIVPLVPLGLMLGRLANFINGELWGRVTDVPWAMVFPWVDGQPRHPSQLYEMLLEGGVLFLCLWWLSGKRRPYGIVTAGFLAGYASMRFVVEFFREPDVGIGFIWADWMTLGQLLTLPMWFAALGIVYWVYGRGRVVAALSACCGMGSRRVTKE
jgi:phosphatidylglycerol---prolipoprotein diacylglyceryl transferase